MSSTDRHHEILSLLEERGFVALQELVSEIGVSESTIRRDLDSLCSDGRLRRTRGGAIPVMSEARTQPVIEPSGRVPSSENFPGLPGSGHERQAKGAIGRAAARLVGPGETVLLDGGSTTLEVARCLRNQPVQVVTNSLPVVNLLFGCDDVEVVMLGGLLYPRSGVALGAMTDAALEQFRVQTLLIGCGGVREDGLYNQNSLLVDAERRMLDAADRRVLVTDSTKFGHAELVRLCGLERIDQLVTDDRLPSTWRSLLEAAGIAVTLVSLDDEAGGRPA